LPFIWYIIFFFLNWFTDFFFAFSAFFWYSSLRRKIYKEHKSLIYRIFLFYYFILLSIHTHIFFSFYQHIFILLHDLIMLIQSIVHNSLINCSCCCLCFRICNLSMNLFFSCIFLFEQTLWIFHWKLFFFIITEWQEGSTVATTTTTLKQHQ
jgi:hypothetical protein